jgi:DNA invertase Pin-like site-specific DNA recombinase
MRLKGKKNKKINDGCISTREAAKILGIALSTVSRYFDRGILAGEQHPITNLRRISKASVFALMKKYGMQWKEQS